MTPKKECALMRVEIGNVPEFPTIVAAHAVFGENRLWLCSIAAEAVSTPKGKAAFQSFALDVAQELIRQMGSTYAGTIKQSELN